LSVQWNLSGNNDKIDHAVYDSMNKSVQCASCTEGDELMPPAHHDTKFNNPFLALHYRNFRLYWIGMCISLIGTWMQNIAEPWLALSITNNAFLVSLVSAAQFVPTMLLSLFSGAILDKVNRKHVLMITQTGYLVISIIFSVMIFTGHIQYSYILILAFCLGLFNAFDAPCRQSFIYELVDKKEDLPNAIALNSMAFNVARILGPSIAGLVMASMGVGACYIINAVSFLAILTSLFFIKTQYADVRNSTHKRIMEDIRDGLHYVRDRKILITSLIVLLIVTTFVPNFNVLISAYSKFVLKGNESTFGYLMSFLGLGSFFGAFLFALNSRKGPQRIIIIVMPFVTAVFLIMSGIVSNFAAAGILLALTGFSFVLTTSTINSTLQINTDPQYRGRVMSLYTLVFQGSTPVGSMYAGYFTQQFSPHWGFYSCGAAVLILMSGAVVFYRRHNRKMEGSVS